MTIHAADGRAAAQRVAGEVRAEMARQKKTTAALAQALGIGAHTAGRRVSGEIPFDVLELAVVAHWLSVPLERLVGGTQEAA